LFSTSEDVGVDIILLLLLLLLNVGFGSVLVSFLGVDDMDILVFSIVLIVPLRVLRSLENSLISLVEYVILSLSS